MLALLAAVALLAPAPAPAPRDPDGDFLAFAQTPRRPGNLLARSAVVGHSAQGRPIAMHQLGDPRWSGARHFATMARMAFRSMRWPAGAAPNWQNRRFASPAFVVELPQGRLVPKMQGRLSKALVRWADG